MIIYVFLRYGYAMNSYLPYNKIKFCSEDETRKVTEEFMTYGGMNIPDDASIGYVLEVKT